MPTIKRPPLMKHSAMACALALIAMPSAHAQASADEAELEAVVVSGQRSQPTGPINGYVGYQSSTASKTGASILATPQSVNLIGAKELTDRNAQSISQAIGYTPGVFVSTSPVSTRHDFFSIRGFNGTNSGTALDGLRSTTAQSYDRLQPYGMERIEVLSGPSGALYGSGSPGGLVNMISKRPTQVAQHEIGFQYGSHRRLQTQVDLSGPLNEDKTMLYRLVGVARNADAQVPHVPDDTRYIAPSLTWQPDDRTALTLLASASRDRFGPPRPFLPIQGSLLPNPNGDIPRHQYLDGKGLDNHLDQSNIGYQLDHELNERWGIHSSARFSHKDLLTQTFSGMGLEDDMRTVSRAAYEFRIKSNVFSMDNHVKGKWATDSLKGTAVMGLAYRHTDEDYYLNYGQASSIDLYHPDHGGDFSAPMAFAKTRQKAHEIGVYTAHTVTLNNQWVLDVSARQDWVSTDTDNLMKHSDTRQRDRAFTYRTGLTYQTEFGLAPYLGYTTSFSPVLGTNFYGDAYQPTKGKQWEAGLKYAPVDMDALFTIAAYHLRQSNVLTSDPDNRLNSLQTGEVTSQGLELSAKANLTPAFNVLASYAYNDLENTQTNNAADLGHRPTGKPKHTATLWGDYTVQQGPLVGFGLGAGVRYVGTTYADAQNTLKVPHYTLVDAALHYDFSHLSQNLKGLNLALNINNLFNKHHYTTCSSTSCDEGYDRSVMATLNYRW